MARKKSDEPETSATRSTVFEVFVEKEQRQAILNSIRRYRAACRQMFGTLLLAQAAGGEIEQEDDKLSVKPNGAAATAILEAAMNKSGKMLGYSMRDWFFKELYPDAMSFVWDSARRDLETAWKSKDPEFTRATRGWLALQGARNITQFNRRGVGFPAATARPQLDKHTLKLKWDHTIGHVEFKLGRLDGGRYFVWHQLRDAVEGWSLGTLYLGERDGELKVTISHQRPLQLAEVDADKKALLRISPEGCPQVLFSLEAGDAQDIISNEEVLPWLRMMKVRREELERRRAACGSSWRPWGYRKGWNDTQAVLTRSTKAREDGVKDRNHCWTRRIVSRLIAWRCGLLTVDIPRATLGDEPWNWSQFESFLRYKTSERGIVLAVLPKKKEEEKEEAGSPSDPSQPETAGEPSV